MAEGLTRLVREVERVVTAPYVPSLQVGRPRLVPKKQSDNVLDQDLYNLVQHSSSSAIASWALQKPCQVGLLADALVEGLSRSRVALPLLAAFGEEYKLMPFNFSVLMNIASATRFRDALLCRHPVILDTFLEKAVDAAQADVSVLPLQVTVN